MSKQRISRPQASEGTPLPTESSSQDMQRTAQMLDEMRETVEQDDAQNPQPGVEAGEESGRPRADD